MVIKCCRTCACWENLFLNHRKDCKLNSVKRGTILRNANGVYEPEMRGFQQCRGSSEQYRNYLEPNVPPGKGYATREIEALRHSQQGGSTFGCLYLDNLYYAGSQIWQELVEILPLVGFFNVSDTCRCFEMGYTRHLATSSQFWIFEIWTLLDCVAPKFVSNIVTAQFQYCKHCLTLPWLLNLRRL